MKSSKMNVSVQSDPLDPLESFLQLLSAPEELAVSRPDENAQDLVASALRQTCQHLFHRLRVLSSLHYQARQKPEKIISDLPSLVLVADENGTAGSGPLFHGAETVWGQIAHIQSGPLRSLLKSSLLRLCNTQGDASSIGPIRLLEDGDASFESDDQSSTGGSGESAHGSDHSNEEGVDDAETKRIRARMMRVMNDMEEDGAGSGIGSSNSSTGDCEKNDDVRREDDSESLLDPAVQELNDGIFDFHEMEAFADEEEEYLPDSAFGIEKPDSTIKTRSLHARLRDGDSPSGEDDEDRSDEDPENHLFHSKAQRRRKYRDDEDIDALHKLYETRQSENDEDDSVLHMTALEMFGEPNPKYFKKWNGRKEGIWKAKDAAHSWVDDELDREDSQSGDKAGWSDEYPTRGIKVRRDSILTPDAKEASDVAVDRLALQAEALEQELIAEKPWQMRGEASSISRPVNSLLVSRPEYEVAAKIAPTMTAENAMLVEEVIKRRVLNEEWDDVIPRELPDVGWNLRRGDLPEVSQEKSKLSLGELYERDYLKAAMGYDVEASESKAEVDKVQLEIRSLFASLCSRLDALSNYQFTPRPVSETTEVRVLATPAIAMEEVLPLHVSEARASAPQELHLAKRGREGVLRSEAELEPTDRKKARSAKKNARRKARKAKLADEKIASRLLPNLGVENPYEKRRISMELHAARAEGKVTRGQVDSGGNYADSGTFFRRLQNETEQANQGKKFAVTKKEPSARKESNSLKL